MDELMFDLDQETAKKLLEKAWSRKYGFLMIKTGQPTENKYFDKFDSVKLNQI